MKLIDKIIDNYITDGNLNVIDVEYNPNTVKAVKKDKHVLTIRWINQSKDIIVDKFEIKDNVIVYYIGGKKYTTSINNLLTLTSVSGYDIILIKLNDKELVYYTSFIYHKDKETFSTHSNKGPP